jgi:predicted peptidase
MLRFRIELVLILAFALLIGQFAWPSCARWWQLPSPGTVGVQAFEPIGAIAPEYAIYLPKDYDDTPASPLIVFLHGSGHRGSDPERVSSTGPLAEVTNGTHFPAIVVAPQCHSGGDWQPAAVVHMIEQVESAYRVDRQRIYLVGYSMGGYGAWGTAAAYPELFAAIVPICGGGDVETAKSLASVPVWDFHGENDEVVPLVESKKMVTAIRAAGGQPRLTVLPEAGHGICEAVFRRSDLWDWLLAQQRGSTPTNGHETKIPSVH